MSGGENQKLAIARAYLKPAKLVILDEPTATVDPISEYRIYQNFHQLTKGKSAVYFSHRLSSVKFSDKIIYLENKRVAESGTHQELMKGNGGYAKLYQMQAQYYLELGNCETRLQS